MPKPRMLQLGEVDVTQRIIESLTNVCTRAVLFSVKSEARDAASIARILGISPSTAYKTLSNLEDLALVEVERFVFSDGKKTKLYRSRIGSAEITMDGSEPVLNLHPNPDRQ